MHRPEFPANILVVKARFRRRDHEVVINRRRDVEIAIDRPVSKFDFQSMQTFAVTNGSERRGLNGVAFDVGNDFRGIGRLWRIARNRRGKQEYGRE